MCKFIVATLGILALAGALLTIAGSIYHVYMTRHEQRIMKELDDDNT